MDARRALSKKSSQARIHVLPALRARRPAQVQSRGCGPSMQAPAERALERESKRLLASLSRPALSEAEKRHPWISVLEENIGAIVRAAERMRGRGVPFADLVQEGALALFSAIETVDSSGDVAFGDYAARLVSDRLADFVGEIRVTGTSSSGLLENALAPDSDALLVEAQRVEQAHALLGLLERDAQSVLKLRFGIDTTEPTTLEATAKSLGMNRSRVSHLESRALRTLRRAAHRLRWTFPR